MQTSTSTASDLRHRDYQILLIEDSPSQAEATLLLLKEMIPSAKVHWQRSLDAPEVLAWKLKPALILCPLASNGKSSGLELWELCRVLLPEARFVLMSEKPVHQAISELGVCSDWLPMIMEKAEGTSKLKLAIDTSYSHSELTQDCSAFG